MNHNKEIASITQKCLAAGGVAAVIDLAQSGGRELPLVKLTRKEMQALKGGRINLCGFAIPIYQHMVQNGTDAQLDAAVSFAQSCGYDII